MLLALEGLDFFNLYYHLAGLERMNFTWQTCARFLHVILERVDSPGKGRHNKLKFATAAVRSTSELDTANALALRLIDRSPAVLLGFTVYDPLGRGMPKATTVTYTFQWPPPATTSAGVDRIIGAIVASEDALQEQGKE